MHLGGFFLRNYFIIQQLTGLHSLQAYKFRE